MRPLPTPSLPFCRRPQPHSLPFHPPTLPSCLPLCLPACLPTACLPARNPPHLLHSLPASLPHPPPPPPPHHTHPHTPAVIQHFINDYERHGRYTGFPSMGVEWQKMESPVLRQALGMQVAAGVQGRVGWGGR